MIAKDLTGMKFGRWTAISPAERKSDRPTWRCVCDCGIIRDVIGENLTRGMTTSCGCFRNEICKVVNLKHGRSRTRTYNCYISMLSRCANPKNARFESYGGRGISVCERWRQGYLNFLSDMGECPRGKSIDRIENDGNYEPSNCRWADSHTQNRNKRTNRMLTVGEKTMCAMDWSIKTGLHVNTISYRMDRGWDTGDILSQPYATGRHQ